MTTNLETRQNDVVDTSKNPWPGDLFRELWQNFKSNVRRITWVERREQRRENERREQEQKEKQDLKNQRESTDTTWRYKEEIERATRGMEDKIKELSRLEWKEKSYTYSDLLGPSERYPDFQKGTKLWLTDETIEEKWDHACLIKWPSVQLQVFCNYVDRQPYSGWYNYMHCTCVIKQPDGDIVLDDMTMWDFRRLVDTINKDLDNRIKKAQEDHKRAMERIAWQKIAQNNEEYHQQEEQQADTDLESQLWNLA